MLWLAPLLLLGLASFSAAEAAPQQDAKAMPRLAEGCLGCHSAAGLRPGHRFAAAPCTACHGGDPLADTEAEAHRAMEGFPGLLDNAQKTCGDCHPRQVAGVLASPMTTGARMVAATRRAFGETAAEEGGRQPKLSALGHSPADSLLRKLCAGCHLGQPKTAHAVDPASDRGGGCLACHINDYPATGHPALTRKVQDGRCFGCHSRSGRIALNYAGLGETDEITDAHRPAYLPDGRLVGRKPPDIHHQAGLACSDCHTGAGLMNLGADPEGGIDIACSDCHRNRNPRTEGASGRPLSTANGTPLSHLETAEADNLLLRRRHDGVAVPVPQIQDRHGGAEHANLSCQACHAQWTPQCYGCHLEYTPQGKQWDHAAQRLTAGRWRQTRWATLNAAPVLGVSQTGSIEVVVPGMTMSVRENPPPGSAEAARNRFQRQFARLAPHTTGAARTCEDCHHSPRTLGLGAGRLWLQDGALRFHPELPPQADGLALDAWTGLDAAEDAATDPRPFTPGEIESIFRALDASP